MNPDRPDDDTLVATLPNGVRVVAIRTPQVETASVGVYMRTGSAHERRALSGISHVVEHMVFKGTRRRDARRINFDAESLGAEVNAHTDKDHTAFHMRGLAEHAGAQLHMLAELVQQPTFPEDELERERAVLLQEFTETEDDPVNTAFELFDRACFGLHPVAQPVIGTRGNIGRFTRAELLGHVARQYTAANTVVGVAGAIDPDAIVREALAAFGAMPGGAPNRVDAATYVGGLRLRRHVGSSQTHMVLGFPLPTLHDESAAGPMAAALFGEGMSSPLLDSLRERHGLAYYVACSADQFDMAGQFVIEASLAPDRLGDALRESMRLLAAQAGSIDAADLERARRQTMVRQLHAQQKPLRRIEDAALELFVHGRVRSHAERLMRLRAVEGEAVRAVFERMLLAGPSLALTGALARGAREAAGQALSAG
ncbi:MAG: insulinase family protein [Rhizobacter sp.]|nr:insulinase family protein [Rhizobacter sp.]